MDLDFHSRARLAVEKVQQWFPQVADDLTEMLV